MEDDNQEYSLYKLSIDIFRQAIVHLSIKLLQVFIIINTKPSIEIIFNKSSNIIRNYIINATYIYK